MYNVYVNLIFYTGIAVLVLLVVWFLALYEIANQDINKRIDISKPTQNAETGYNYEIRAPSVHTDQSNDGGIRTTIDVGGIITAAIGASISVVVSKLLNRYWPDRKKFS